MRATVGGRRRLDGEARRLVRGHFHLVGALARRHFELCCRTVPFDELVGEAQLAMAYAASLYDAGRGVPFGAYATLVIRHHLTQAVTAWRRHVRRGQRNFSDLLGGDVAAGPAAFDPPCPRTASAGRLAAAQELLDRVRRVLPPRWFEALELYYAHGHTLEEVGARLGVSRERVRQLMNKALARARSHLPREVEAA